MQGIEKAYCDVCIQALINAWQVLMEKPVADNLRRVRYGKGDTLGLDAATEIAIYQQVISFDQHAILVTEELDTLSRDRWPVEVDPIKQPLMLFSDPTDRSRQLEKFLTSIAPTKEQQSEKTASLIKKYDVVVEWEKLFEKPATITGPTGSITCIRKGTIIFSLILNYITGNIFITAPTGIYYLRLTDLAHTALKKIDVDYLVAHGKKLDFMPTEETCTSTDDQQRFITFLGKTGYQENLDDCMIFVEHPERFIPENHQEPGGPARILYLSRLQKGFGPIGFILANGEKIGEWIPWLAFAKFARNSHGNPALKIYEIAIDRPWTKEGVLMSTAPPYSIFQKMGDQQQFYLDVSRLRKFPHPSRFRSMIVITPFDNNLIINTMHQHQYREIFLE